MSEDEEKQHERQMSPLLAIGIFVAPLLFAWFTLRDGYSKAARLWSFGWMIAFTAFALLIDPPAKTGSAQVEGPPDRREAAARRAEERRKEAAQEAAQAKAVSNKAEECSRHAPCIAATLEDHVPPACSTVLEREARYDFKWERRSFKRQWTTAKWAEGYDEPYRVLELRGSILKLQNGFGAWARHAYACEYDLQTDKIMGVKIFPGRPELWEALPIQGR